MIDRKPLDFLDGWHFIDEISTDKQKFYAYFDKGYPIGLTAFTYHFRMMQEIEKGYISGLPEWRILERREKLWGYTLYDLLALEYLRRPKLQSEDSIYELDF